MDALSVLIAIALIHCSLFFFDTLFKSCSHFPYLYFLENTGLEIQILRVKWFTTAFNRKIIKWGMDRSRFWTAWFNAGVIISIILLPIAVIIILKMTFNMWLAGSSSDASSGAILEPMLPGVDVPFNEIGYYATTLAICSIVHELGHALAAAREDVQLFGLGIVIVFTIPIAYVHISNEQLVALPLRNQLRIACAGIWHNIILATIAAAVLVFSTWLWAPLYNIGSGVYVKTILPNSPVLGPTGLLEHDIIYKLNNCPVKHSEDWYDCMLQTIQHSAPGYCVKQSFIQGILLHYFFQKKSVAEAHRILVETYGDHALSETTCRDWIRRFKNNDFDVENKERSGAPKKFEDEELEALLDEDPCQMQNELAESLGVDHTTVAKRLKALGMIQKQGNWVKQQELIQDYDESVPAKQKTNGAVNCCTTDSEINGNLCFEYIEGPQTAPLHLPPHSCLPVRAMLNQSQNFCQASHECLSQDTHCMKPSLDNVTKIVQIKRKIGKDVLFFGHPADIYRTVDVSDWVPKYSFLYPKLPESFALLCKYITVFSAGLAIINVVPCFFLDGQYILNIIVLYLLNSMPHNKNIRESTVLIITSIGTLLLITNLMYLLINKLL